MNLLFVIFICFFHRKIEFIYHQKKNSVRDCDISCYKTKLYNIRVNIHKKSRYIFEKLKKNLPYSMKKYKKLNQYEINFNAILGKGATGNVYQGINMNNGESLAIKVIDLNKVQNEVTTYLLEGQKKAMKTINNPYVVKCYDVIEQGDNCYVIMEKCVETLKEKIVREKKIGIDETIEMFRKIVIGYNSIIQNLFIHRDLKPTNIMIRSNGQPVIIDFGFCEMIMGKRPLLQYNVGSPTYMSPESHFKNRYSQKSDIWSLGTVLYEMLTGRTLDEGYDIKPYFQNIEKILIEKISLPSFSPLCQDLLSASLAINTEQRATIHKLKYLIDKSRIPKFQVAREKPVLKSRSHQNPLSLGVISSQQASKQKPSIEKNFNSQDYHSIKLRKPPHILNSPAKQAPLTPNSNNSISSVFIKKQYGNFLPHHFQVIQKKNFKEAHCKNIFSLRKQPREKQYFEKERSKKRVGQFQKAFSLPFQQKEQNIRVL